MPKKIKIADWRLCSIWAETWLHFLATKPPPGASLAFMGRDYSYIHHFEKIQQEGSFGGLEMPWDPWYQGDKCFWTSHLDQGSLDNINGNDAWRQLMPLAGKVPVSVQANWLPGRINLMAFYYPHGLALLIRATCHGNFSLDEMVSTALDISKREKFQVQWQDGGTPESLSHAQLAEKVLALLRARALGEKAVPEASSGPFTVVTVVKGSGVNVDQPMSEYGKVHRALEALTTWRPDYQHVALPRLADTSLPMRPAAPSHVFYGHSRGRAVWFPELFTKQVTDKNKKITSLSCFHSNLTFMSMQVESLCGLVTATDNYIQRGEPLSDFHKYCAKLAVDILGRYYGRAVKHYRSWSPLYQIEQNDMVGVINRVREYLGREPLKRRIEA